MGGRVRRIRDSGGTNRVAARSLNEESEGPLIHRNRGVPVRGGRSGCSNPGPGTSEVRNRGSSAWRGRMDKTLIPASQGVVPPDSQGAAAEGVHLTWWDAVPWRTCSAGVVFAHQWRRLTCQARRNRREPSVLIIPPRVRLFRRAWSSWSFHGGIAMRALSSGARQALEVAAQSNPQLVETLRLRTSDYDSRIPKTKS